MPGCIQFFKKVTFKMVSLAKQRRSCWRKYLPGWPCELLQPRMGTRLLRSIYMLRPTKLTTSFSLHSAIDCSEVRMNNIDFTAHTSTNISSDPVMNLFVGHNTCSSCITDFQTSRHRARRLSINYRTRCLAPVTEPFFNSDEQRYFHDMRRIPTNIAHFKKLEIVMFPSFSFW